MLTIKRILFPTDFSRCSDQALIHAIYLSRRYTAELHVLNAIVLNEHLREGGIMAVSDLESELERQAAKHLASLGKGALASLPIVFSRHRGYSAAEVILDYVSGKDIDLVVMGTHGRRGLGHLLLGSVAEEVVRMATCPVLTLREKEHVPVPTEVSRILVPVDYSDHSREAIAYAKHLGHEYGARLQLLHVIEETIHPSFYVTGQSSVFSWFPELEAHARREMQSILSEVPGPKVPAEFHLLEGRASSDIVKFAEREKSDLVVIATHGLTGLQHMLLGSVTEKVVRMSPCPVFTVRSFGKALMPGLREATAHQ